MDQELFVAPVHSIFDLIRLDFQGPSYSCTISSSFPLNLSQA